MHTIRSFTAEDATVIIGNVFDESMGDALRVTMVATGLNGVGAQQKPKLVMAATPMVRDGTTNQPIYTGAGNVGYMDDDEPAVFTQNSGRRAQVDAMKKDGIEEYDIPAFLRKQAD
jgi:cell division protein FtsZ